MTDVPMKASNPDGKDDVWQEMRPMQVSMQSVHQAQDGEYPPR